MSDITLKPANRADRVLLKDEATDADRVYTFAVLTRSRKKDIREIQQRIEELQFDDHPTDEQEAAGTRAVCDLISAVLVGKDDSSPKAGDVLYEAWEAEKITDDQIQALLDDLTGATQDPT